MGIGILACGSYVPEMVVNNALVAEWTGASPDWIQERTGVSERRYAPDELATSDLGYRAVLSLLAQEPAALDDLIAIVLATSTPDQPQPATAAVVQRRLGLEGIPAFDINAVCSGFVYATVVAASLARDARSHALVVAADKYSTIMDHDDRKTVSLFGDGAGAILLGPVPDGYGLRSQRLVTHGDHADLVRVKAGGTKMPLDTDALDRGDQLFRMEGRAVREYALDVLPKLIHSTLDDAQLTVADVDRFVLHQANPRLLEALAEQLGIPADKVPLTAPMYGNAGAASIPVTLHSTDVEKPLQRGDQVVFASVGGGMTAGVSVWTWY
jgi:3-oxoacyl-(acyl-carrier-protein) synthase III